MYQLVVKNGHLVLPSGVVRADLGIVGGTIGAIGVGLEGQEVLDATDLWVLPGLVDPHVHPIHAEDYRSVSEAAVFGGVTTVLHHLYLPLEEDPWTRFVAERQRAEETSIVDFTFHARLTNRHATMDTVARFVNAGSPSLKIFMAHANPDVVIDDVSMYRIMRGAEQCGGIVLVHGENGPLCRMLENEAAAEGRTSLEDYFRARPRWLEAEAVNRAIFLARLTDCPTYFVHLSCKESVDCVAQAKQAGVKVHGETCPQYLVMSAAAAEDLGSRAKLAPPLRTDGDINALWWGLQHGVIDTIGSDHSAFSMAEKDGAGNSVFEAGYGVPGIEHMLQLLYEQGVVAGKISMSRLIDALATRPALVFGLFPRKGALYPGADADFVLFDTRGRFRIDNTQLHGAAYYSIYDGFEGRGVVCAVFQRGRALMMDGKLLGKPGDGTWLRREPHVRAAGAWRQEATV